MHFDVFNGDADGIIGLLQLRLAEPKQSELITGVKRDISLLKQVDVQRASSVTVLDISLEKNIDALQQLLAHDCRVFYIDHHRSGDIPVSEHLTTLIDTDANTCTSLLVNKHLNGRYCHWAIAAAFGDNMTAAAQQLAEQQGLTPIETEQLKALGVYINYNGYGRSVEDLHFHPAELFRQLLAYPDPLLLVNEQDSLFATLAAAYQQDMALAEQSELLFDSEHCQVLLLADAPWARRVSGVFGNELANRQPERAHAVLTKNLDGSYTVSVRAPLANKQGADVICSQFVSGGGRAAAAGINQLAESDIDTFIRIMAEYYQ